MPHTPLGCPEPDEYFAYYGQYISLVPSDDLVGYMTDQISVVQAALAPVTEAKALWRYGPGKWSIKEVVGHLTDTERVFQYRAMSIARRDPAPLPGFDQDVWVANAGSDDVALSDLVAEWTLIRRATIAFIRALPAAAVMRAGSVGGHSMSVRALCYIPVGHTTYHLRLLDERYFSRA
jgi:hypothetical protein